MRMTDNEDGKYNHATHWTHAILSDERMMMLLPMQLCSLGFSYGPSPSSSTVRGQAIIFVHF